MHACIGNVPPVPPAPLLVGPAPPVDAVAPPTPVELVAPPAPVAVVVVLPEVVAVLDPLALAEVLAVVPELVLSPELPQPRRLARTLDTRMVRRILRPLLYAA
jgi:hypothetical protein